MLSVNKRKAFAALLEHKSNEEAAEALGISRRTLQSYLADEEVQAEISKQIEGLIEKATGELKRGLSDAIYLLRMIIEDTQQSTNSRITAARTILEYALRYSEFNDILTELRKNVLHLVSFLFTRICTREIIRFIIFLAGAAALKAAFVRLKLLMESWKIQTPTGLFFGSMPQRCVKAAIRK